MRPRGACGVTEWIPTGKSAIILGKFGDYCKRWFTIIEERMRYIVLASLFLLACGGSDSAAPNNDMQIGGNWTFGGNMSAGTVSCTAQGSLQINQSGAQFSGTGQQAGTCVAADGSSIDNSGAITVSGGSITGTHVSFQGGVCNYEGTGSGDPVNTMTGTSTCHVAVGGQTVVFTGNWQAGK